MIFFFKNILQSLYRYYWFIKIKLAKKKKNSSYSSFNKPSNNPKQAIKQRQRNKTQPRNFFPFPFPSPLYAGRDPIEESARKCRTMPRLKWATLFLDRTTHVDLSNYIDMISNMEINYWVGSRSTNSPPYTAK